MSVNLDLLDTIKPNIEPTQNIYKPVGTNIQGGGIDNKLLQNLRKHSQGSYTILPENVDNYIEHRAVNQSTWDRIGNVFAQTVGEFVGGTIEGMDALGSFMPKFFSDTEAFTRSTLGQLGADFSEYMREVAPIYMTKKAQEGTILERMTGGGYWSQLLPSVFGSALSIMLPAKGASMLLKGVGKLAIGATSKSKRAADIFKIATTFGKGKAVAKLNKISDVYASAAISRIIDSSREAYGKYEESYQWFLNNYKKYIDKDKNGNKILKINNQEIPLTNDNIEELAKDYANSAAYHGYLFSMGNIFYDLIEWTGITNASKVINRATRNNIRKLMGTNDKFANVRALNAIPGANNRHILGDMGRFIYGSGAEMADEMSMSIAMSEGERWAKDDFGFLTNEEKNLTFANRLGEYIKDPDIITEGIGGLLGGAGMQIVMPYIGKAFDKSFRRQETEYLKGLERAIDSMRSGLDGMAESLANGDIITAKQQLRQSVIDQVAANQMDGSLDFYIEMLDNMDKAMQNLLNIKKRKDNNQSITAEEQMALDAAGNMIDTPNIYKQILNQIKLIQPIFAKNYATVDEHADPEHKAVQWELARRKSVYEAHKALNSKELEQISVDDTEYLEMQAKADNYIDDYLNRTYTTEEIRSSKKTNMTNYQNNKNTLATINKKLSFLNRQIEASKNKLSEIDEALTQVSDEEQHTIGRKLQLEKLATEHTIEHLNKEINTLNENKNNISTLQKGITDLTDTDKKAAEEADTFLRNKTTTDTAIEDLEYKNKIIDSELSYLDTEQAYKDIKEQLDFYKSDINTEINQDIKDKLDAYNNSTDLEKDVNKFQDSEEAKKAYERKLKELKLNEKQISEQQARQEAIAQTELERKTKEALKARGINLEENNNIEEETELPEFDDNQLLNETITRAIQNGMSIKDYINDKIANSNDATKNIYKSLLNYIESLEQSFESTFDKDINTTKNDILQQLVRPYIPITGYPYGRPSSYELKDKTISYNPRDYIDDTSRLRAYLIYTNAIIADIYTKEEKQIPGFLLDANFGIGDAISSDDINKIVNKLNNKADAIINRFSVINDMINRTINNKNAKSDLYVSINGIEYKVLNTRNAKSEVGLILEGFDEQINRYATVPESQSTPNDNYILIEKPKNVSLDHTSFPTGDSNISESITEQTIEETNEVSNVTPNNTTDTSYVSNNDTIESETKGLDFELDSNKSHIAFQMDNFNSEEITEYLMSVMNQEEVNTALLEPNVLNAIAFVSNLVAHTTYGKKDYYKKLLSKYITNKKLTDGEKIVIDTAIVLSKNLDINLDNSKCVITPTSASNFSAIYQAINDLAKLYKSKNGNNNFFKDTSSFNIILKDLDENAVMKKFAQVLIGDLMVNPGDLQIKLDRSLKEQAEDLIESIGDDFGKRVNLLFNLIAYINDQRGFKISEITMYDLVNALRMYRGDNYADIIPEIINIVTAAKYVKRELINKLNFFNKQYKATNNKFYKDSYNYYKLFNEMLDIEGEYRDLSDDAGVINFINNNNIISFGNAHQGLDISFDTEHSPNVLINNYQTDEAGIYEILNKVQVGDDVTLVQTNKTENPNKAEYDIIYTDKDTGKEYKLGTIPALQTIKNGVAYVVKGKNGVYNMRKFNFTENVARVFSEYQNILYQFMYNYSIAFEPRNNVAEYEKDKADKAINIFIDNFRNKKYDTLRNAFKEVIYGNLSTSQINEIINSGITSAVISGKLDAVGEVKMDELPLAIGQIYQLCKDMFAGVNISKAMGRGTKSYQSISNTFANTINKQQAIFKHNLGIRGDIKATNDMTMSISNLAAGQVIINDESKQEENAARKGIGLDHSRNSLIRFLKPCNLVEVFGEKPRPLIIQIDEDGYAHDVKTGNIIDLSKFSTKHYGAQFTGNRGKMVCVVPQTDNMFTTFPVKPNTVIGAITDDSIEARAKKLNKYNEYISNAIIEILGLTEGNISVNRLEISKRLQNIIICNEATDINDKTDINFQTSNSNDGTTIAVMFKTTLGANVDDVYHKFIKTEQNGKPIITHFASTNKILVANFNGSLDNPDYRGVQAYSLETEESIKTLKVELFKHIPYLTRQFGIYKGLAISKESSNETRDTKSTGFIDPVTEDSYDNIYDYYMNTNAIYSDIGDITDKKGNVISNVTLVGTSPIKFSLDSKEFKDPNAESVQTFYSAVDAAKSIQKGEEFKEDWESLNTVETILEEYAGVKPVFVIHKVKESNIKETGSARPRKVHDGSEILPRGFNLNSYRIDLNYSPKFMASFNNKNYITKTLVHEMLHTFMMKHFNISKNELNDPNIREAKEKLIQFNNEEITNWINDFINSVEAAKKRISEINGQLSKEDHIIKTAITNGLINQLITIFTNEVSTVNDNIQDLLKAREAGQDVILNGQQTLQEPITYAFTEPSVYSLLNVLQSVSERTEDTENIETPTVWQKLLDVIKKIFSKIFGITHTDVNTNSSLERLIDTINKIYSTDMNDINLNNLSIGSQLNIATPGREDDVVARNTNQDSDVASETNNVTTEIEITTTEENVVENKEEIIEEEDEEDEFAPVNGNIKAATTLDINTNSYNELKMSSNKTEKLTRILFDNNAILNENINFDETKRILC